MRGASFIFSITLILLILFTTIVHANSGLTYWEGYPSLEVLSVEENSPIEVQNEELVFDFSKEEYINKGNNSISGLVSARYKMYNPTDNKEIVKMAFPFITSIMQFNPDKIEIKSDENIIPFQIYIGNEVRLKGRNSVETKEDNFDFEKILNSMSNQVYSPSYYDLDEVGTLYTYTIKTQEDVRIAMDYSIDYEKSKVISKGFNGFEGNGSEVKLTSWVRDKETLEVYVFGDEIELNINGYTDGGLTKKTDKFSYELKTEEISIRDYFSKEVETNKHEFIYNDFLAENQIFNLYAKTLDEMIENDVLNLWIDEIYSINYLDRIFVLLYDVEFLPQGTKGISVSYLARGTMDKTETKDPLYIFKYLLNPAKHWDSFKNLSIEIIPPQVHPYIVDSSIELVRNEDGTYTGDFESLPSEDLSFTLYSKEAITLMDKVERHVYNFNYALPLFIIGIIAGFVIKFVYNLILKLRKDNLKK